MKAEENKGSDTNAESADVDSHKALAIVGYIIPILFFIPLVTDAKNNTFAKFHANQQLNLLLFWVIGQIVGTLLSIILIGLIILPLVMVAGVVFMIMGIINSANGEMKKLPLIGGFELIK
jgi:uncharacterized membrane protein